MTTMTTTKMVDKKGRVNLGQDFASAMVIIKYVSKGILEIILAEAVPAKETWLYKNPKALAAVMEGLEDAKAGRIEEGPDMEAGDKLVAELED